MSLLIKGMEMPKDGAYWCEIGIADGIATITIHGEDRKSFHLVPVPPHGDLIDKNRMFGEFVIEGQRSKRYKVGEKWELNGKEIRDAISRLPIIIPAERSEASLCDNCDERSDIGCSWCKRMESSEE